MAKITFDENSPVDRIYIARKLGHDKLPCIICDELIELTDSELRSNCQIFKVCDKCKQAVMKMRETIEHEDKGEEK